MEKGEGRPVGNTCLPRLETSLCDLNKALIFVGFHFLQFTVKYKEQMYSNPVCMLINPERKTLIIEKST